MGMVLPRLNRYLIVLLALGSVSSLAPLRASGWCQRIASAAKRLFPESGVSVILKLTPTAYPLNARTIWSPAATEMFCNAAVPPEPNEKSSGVPRGLSLTQREDR